MSDSGINRILNSLRYNHPRSFETAPSIYLSSTHSPISSDHSSRPTVVVDHYQSPENLGELGQFKTRPVLVVKGHNDYLDRVLDSFGIPFKQIAASDLSEVLLREALAVFVNCCDEFSTAHQLTPFVMEGGLLLTTDRAVKHVLEVGFPKTVQHNGKETEQLSLRDTPLIWHVRPESYPIAELDSRVEIVLESNEFRKKYGTGSLYVRFPYGHGMVHHVVSELYSQNPETQKQLLIQILANQKNKTKIVDENRIQTMLASEEEVPPSQTPEWKPLTERMKWNPLTSYFHFHMPREQKRIILGSNRKTEDGLEPDEKISSDPYLFPHHVLIERFDKNQYRITLLHNFGVVVLHQNKELKILRNKGESWFLERGHRIALTDKVQFIFDPQP